MRWPFSKQARDLALPALDEQRWSVAQAEVGGVPAIVRVNDTARAWRGHGQLPVKVGFAVRLNRPNGGGLPDPAENEQLAAIEDLVAAKVMAAGTGMHVLTLTTGLMQEYVFYVPIGLDVAQLHEGIRRAVESHEVQCFAVTEPAWDTYCELTS